MLGMLAIYVFYLMMALGFGFFHLPYLKMRKAMAVVAAIDIVLFILSYIVNGNAILLFGVPFAMIGSFSSVREIKRNKEEFYYFTIPKNSYKVSQDIHFIIPGNTTMQAKTIIEWEDKKIIITKLFTGIDDEKLEMSCVRDKKDPNLYYCGSFETIDGKRPLYVTILWCLLLFSAMAMPYCGYRGMTKNFEITGPWGELTKACFVLLFIPFARIVTYGIQGVFANIRNLVLDIMIWLAALGVVMTICNLI